MDTPDGRKEARKFAKSRSFAFVMPVEMHVGSFGCILTQGYLIQQLLILLTLLANFPHPPGTSLIGNHR